MPAPPSVASRASRSAGSEDISGSEASSSEEEPPRRTTRLLTGSLPRKAPPRTRASLPERNSQSPKRTGHSAASELHRQRGRRDDSDSVASFNARQRKAAVQEDSASEDSFDVGEELTQAMLRASKDFGKLTEEMREFHVELKDSSLALLDIESLLLSATPPDHPDYSLRLSNIESRFERRSNALDSRAELESERLQRKFEGERDIVGRWFTEHKEKTRKDLLASLNSQLDMVKIEMKILQEFERQGKSFPPGESDEDSDEEGPKKVERTAEDDDDSGYAKPPWEVQSVGSVSNVDEDSAGSDAENERPSRKARHLMDPLLPISALDASTDMALISSLAQKQPYGQSALANPDVFLMLRKLEGIVGRIPALGEAWDNDDPDKVEEMIESVVQEMERRELEYVQRLFEGKAQVADDVDRGMESERSATPEPVEGLDLGRWAVDVDGKDGTTNLKRKREDIVEATA